MWTEENNQLKRTFEFKNFMEAFAFMTKVALIAEKLNHHPNWTNVWNRVEISLCTHDAGNIITEKDRKLAAEIDKLADGSLEIIDYKTGKKKEKVTGDEKNQLLIYQIAAQSLPEYKNLGVVAKLTYYYLEDNVRTEFLGKDEELEELREKISATIDRIKTQDFTATPESHACGFCDFKDICEYRRL